MAKSLAASRLYQGMALEAADDDLDVEIHDELMKYSSVFQDLALDLLDYCYQADDDLTQHLLTASLENWSRQTCLKLAVMANHFKFLAHPLSQAILADLWMGGLRMRKNPGFKIIIGLLCPPSIIKLEFKTREELDLMPQTEEEFHDRNDRTSSSSTSSSSTSSRRSSLNPLDLDTRSINSMELGNKVFRRGANYRGDENDGDHLQSRVYHHSGNNTERNDFEDWHDMSGIPDGHFYTRHDFLIKRKTRPLKWKKKLYEFYAAPITKFFSHSVSYLFHFY